MPRTTNLFLKNQGHQNQPLFPILLMTSIPLYHNQPYKKSGSMKFSKEFQKSGMTWPSWNKKFNSVLLLIRLPNKKASPNWTFPKNWVSKTQSFVEACLWTISRHAEIKTWPKSKRSSQKKWTWKETKGKISYQALPISFASNWMSIKLCFQWKTSFLCNHNLVLISYPSPRFRKR